MFGNLLSKLKCSGSVFRKVNCSSFGFWLFKKILNVRVWDLKGYMFEVRLLTISSELACPNLYTFLNNFNFLWLTLISFILYIFVFNYSLSFSLLESIPHNYKDILHFIHIYFFPNFYTIILIIIYQYDN